MHLDRHSGLLDRCLYVSRKFLHRKHRVILVILVGSLLSLGLFSHIGQIGMTRNQLTAASSPTSSSMLAYTPLPAPTRICDTRPGNPSGLSGLAAQCNDKPLAYGTTLSVAMPSSVPSDAGAVVVNLTVTDPTTAGYLTVYPASSGSPPRSPT